MYCNLSCCCF